MCNSLTSNCTASYLPLISANYANCLIDTTPPLVTLNGNDTICVEVDLPYTDLGASGYDSCDGDVTDHIILLSNVNTSLIGTYYEKYIVSDSSGNVSDTAIRIVHVITDYTPPIITPNGLNNINIKVNSSFRAGSYSAFDNKAGNLTDSVKITHNVNTSRLGKYLINYYVETESNVCMDNYFASVDRVAYVIDDIDPIIKAKDSNPVNIGLNDNFDFLKHITVSDNHCDQQFLIDSLVIIANDVDPRLAGLYSVSAETRDSAANLSNLFVLYVIVKDNASVSSKQFDDFEIYPNPSSGVLNVSHHSPIQQINVLNVHGQLMQSVPVLNAKSKLFTFNGATGLYYIEIITSEGLSYRKNVIKY